MLLLSGDFQQTLFVVQWDKPTDKLNACIKLSYLLNYIKTVMLNIWEGILIETQWLVSLPPLLLNICDSKIAKTEHDKVITFPGLA